MIIEPVLKTKYLTKLKRLLPSFFDEFENGEIEKAILDGVNGARADAERDNGALKRSIVY